MCKHLDRLSGFHLWHWPLLVEVIPNDITGRRDPHRVMNDSPAEEIFEPRFAVGETGLSVRLRRGQNADAQSMLGASRTARWRY
jgi:hypothetical protein